MMSFKCLPVVLLLTVLTSGRIILVVNEKIIGCDEYPPETNAGMFDSTNLHLIPENDTHTFLNGTIKFLRDLKNGWGVRIYTEHKIQGKWVMQAFDRKYPDLCNNLNNPLEPFYPSIRDKKKCPLSAGDEWIFNMFSMELPPSLLAAIPSHYMGQWRVTLIGLFKINGVEMYECNRGFADLFDG